MARPPAWPTDLASPLGDDGRTAPRPRHPGASSSSSASQQQQQHQQHPQQQPRGHRQHRHHPRHGSLASNLGSSGFEPGSLGALDLDLDISQLAADSSSSDSEFTSSRPAAQKPGGGSHSRSMSNPFPSLFSSNKKKKKGKEASGPGFGDSDSSGVDEPVLSPPRANNGSTNNSHTTKQVSPSRGGRKTSFSTGPCITCGSLVRWAQGVDVYRCTICLTVNDLPGRSTEGSASQAKTSQQPGDARDSISVERTRSIIKRCLRKYLEAVLSDVEVGPTVSPPSRLQQSTPASSMSASVYAPLPASPPSLTPSVPPGGHGRRPSTHLPNIPSADGSDWHSAHGNPSLRHRHGNVSRSAGSANNVYGHAGQATATQAIPIPSSRSVHPPKQDVPEPKKIFKDLEDHIVAHILSNDCLDNSFIPHEHQQQQQPETSASAPAPSATAPPSTRPLETSHNAQQVASSSQDNARSSHTKGTTSLDEVDPKFLLAGNFAENGSWWTGSQRRGLPKHGSSHKRRASEAGNLSKANVDTSRPILIDWAVVDGWYNLVVNAGALWTAVYEALVASGVCKSQPSFMLEQIESGILKGQEHTQRLLLKAIETVLKRPGRRIGELGDYRFLVIALANPLLHASFRQYSGRYQTTPPPPSRLGNKRTGEGPTAARRTGPAAGQHSVVIKRILGLLSNSSDDWHAQLTTCFSRFSDARFMQTKDLVGGFLAYRLVRHNQKQEETKAEVTDGLVPKVSAEASMSTLHAAISQTARPSAKKSKAGDSKKIITHGDDWQIKAAVRVLGLLFSANNCAPANGQDGKRLTVSTGDTGNGNGARSRGHGQILPTSDFYMALLDNSDLVAEFEGWEHKRAKFSFCQYPFLLSIWAKIQILEYEARRQMMDKARDAFFDSIMTHRNVDHHFVLSVRRDCLVEDSLKGVSEAIGSGGEDVKKGLRIIFTGEEGVDAGGLRKEWFLLLVREVFNPDHGMFTYDEESQYCYFNPNSFETSDQFFLVGVVLGLAIYNSTILDIALPPFAFRKLLLAAPPPTSGLVTAIPRPAMTYTLSDLAEYRPRLAHGLKQLLDYDGDVTSTFCLDFTISVDKYGSTETVRLCPNGDRRPVTNSNRREYVDLYVRYLLDTSISRQFEPFKRGFFTVCGCNALSLFRPEEIELLVRGSDEALDITSLRMAATYDNWGSRSSPEKEPSIRWFWQAFEEASPRDQRKLLIFITGSDRIPATGPASLSIRIICLGDDTGRFPTARTCFNTLTLYRYTSKEKLQQRLWDAVHESEGFGLK